MNYLLKTEAPSSPSVGTMISEDNVGMMCRDCPARGWRAQLGQCFISAHGSCGRSAFQMGFSSEGEGHERKEQGPPVLPQGVEREDELRQQVQELRAGILTENSSAFLKANLCSNLPRKFMASCRIHNAFEDNYTVCYLHLNSLH